VTQTRERRPQAEAPFTGITTDQGAESTSEHTATRSSVDTTALVRVTDPLTGALAMSARGWPVFPVDHPDREVCAGVRTVQHDPRTCPPEKRGKHTTVKFTDRATTDPAMIAAELAGATLNYGVYVGGAGLVVLDEDTAGGLDRAAAAHGVALVPTFTVGTGKGRHLYYLAPEGVVLGNTAGGFAEHGVDVRGGNAYVVGPGSTHHSGVVYGVLDDRDPVPLPPWCRELIGTRAVTSTPKYGNVFDEAERGLAVLPKVIDGPRPGKGGQRHQVLVSYAASLRARRTPRTEAVELMNLAWQRCEQPPECTTEAPWSAALAILEHAWTRPAGTSEERARDAAVELGAGKDGAGPVAARTLAEAYAVFGRWLGKDYDLSVLDAVLCAAAVEQLGGDPTWLLVVSGSGAAKTETVAPLAAAGAHVTSTISSEGALLSGTSRKERSKDATGGLLRKIGDTGVLVIKDVTSVLSMNRDARGAVLAALREVYDGRWERNLGSDGGQSLTWTGRLVVIGAVTTAWDRAHEVIASMGDRFVLIRLDSTTGRTASGRQAIANTGDEVTMRAELGAVVAGVLATVDTTVDLTLTTEEAELILALADVVTLGRTGVEHDYRGDVIDAHAPEMPTRFAKQLTQILRGGLALGMNREHLVQIVARCAADSMPPLRLAALVDLLDNPHSTTATVRKSIDKPRATVDRTLQALHMLGLLACDEEEGSTGRTVWRYSLSRDVSTEALGRLRSARNVGTYIHPSLIPSLVPMSPCSDKSGTSLGAVETAHCRVCSQPLIYPPSRVLGICSRRDPEHNAAQAVA